MLIGIVCVIRATPGLYTRISVAWIRAALVRCTRAYQLMSRAIPTLLSLGAHMPMNYYLGYPHTAKACHKCAYDLTTRAIPTPSQVVATKLLQLSPNC